MREGAGDLRFGVDFEQCVEAGGGGGGGQGLDFLVGEGADDDEDGTGAGLPGLEDLNRMDEEILADAGARGRGGAEMRGDAAEVVERAAEEFFVGEHGEGVGAGGLVAGGLIDGGGAGLDVAGGRGAALDFGDDGEAAVGAAQRGGEGRRAGQRGVEAGELGGGDGAEERRDFPALPGHDLGEFVGHSVRKEHTEVSEDKAEKFPCISPRPPPR